MLFLVESWKVESSRAEDRRQGVNNPAKCGCDESAFLVNVW